MTRERRKAMSRFEMPSRYTVTWNFSNQVVKHGNAAITIYAHSAKNAILQAKRGSTSARKQGWENWNWKAKKVK